MTRKRDRQEIEFEKNKLPRDEDSLVSTPSMQTEYQQNSLSIPYSSQTTSFIPYTSQPMLSQDPFDQICWEESPSLNRKLTNPTPHSNEAAANMFSLAIPEESIDSQDMKPFDPTSMESIIHLIGQQRHDSFKFDSKTTLVDDDKLISKLPSNDIMVSKDSSKSQFAHEPTKISTTDNELSRKFTMAEVPVSTADHSLSLSQGLKEKGLQVEDQTLPKSQYTIEIISDDEMAFLERLEREAMKELMNQCNLSALSKPNQIYTFPVSNSHTASKVHSDDNRRFAHYNPTIQQQNIYPMHKPPPNRPPTTNINVPITVGSNGILNGTSKINSNDGRRLSEPSPMASTQSNHMNRSAAPQVSSVSFINGRNSSPRLPANPYTRQVGVNSPGTSNNS